MQKTKLLNGLLLTKVKETSMYLPMPYKAKVLDYF